LSPKSGGNSSFKFNTGNFEGLTPKQTSKVFQRVHTRKTESRLRASQVFNQPETTNCSYNQYGIAEPTSASLGNAALHAFQGSGAHTGYLTSLGHNSPDLVSPLISGNQSHINIRHTRVQSNIVDTKNARTASQSALGLVSNLSTTQQISKQAVVNTLLAEKAKKTVS